MADRKVTVEMSPEGKVKFIKKLMNLPKLLKQIGVSLVSDSRRAFQDQKFAGVPWPEKYPGSPRPFLSVAGVVQDFAEGRNKPRQETLSDRPALHRTGALEKSPAFRPVGEDAIEVGSSLPYATLQHAGGINVQPVSESVKDKIETWLSGTKTKRIFAPDYVSYTEFASWAKAKGYGFKGKGKRSKSGYESVHVSKTATVRQWGSKEPTHENMDKQEVEIAKFRGRLSFLLKPKLTELTTQVNRRPFIGISAERADKISILLAESAA